MTITRRIMGLLAMGWALAACTPESPDGTSDDVEESENASDALSLTSGPNGGACYASGYNCKLRVEGGNRVAHADGTVDWGVDKGVAILDGNGDVMGTSSSTSLKFNYGQRRVFNGKTYVFAMSTSNKSSGWFPLSAVKSGDVLDSRMGAVHAHRAGLSKMACYEVKNSTDDALAEKKVVYDTQSDPGPTGEAAGDYLAKVRANGKRSINLIYNTPGSGLGGPAIDHFPAGTKFQRLDVPTDAGPPSIDVKLWAEDSKGRFRKPAGTLKFVYGYVVSKNGEVRVGWMPYPALTPSSGCK